MTGSVCALLHDAFGVGRRILRQRRQPQRIDADTTVDGMMIVPRPAILLDPSVPDPPRKAGSADPSICGFRRPADIL